MLIYCINLAERCTVDFELICKLTKPKWLRLSNEPNSTDQAEVNTEPPSKCACLLL